jgi:hypothetical protein
MKRISMAVAVGFAVVAIPAFAGTASASATAVTQAVTCGNHATPRSEGPYARDYHWGNCGANATTIEVYSVTYGIYKNLVGEKCVPAGQAVRLGATTDSRVSYYTGEDTGSGC